MKSQSPLVIGLVLNYNGISIFYKGRPILEHCLKTLSQTEYDNYKIIMIDAGSTDGSVDYVRKNFPEVDILKVKNKGFAYANNAGIAYALKRYPTLNYIILINNDMIFNENNWLTKLEQAFYQSPRIGIVGGRLLRPNGSVQHGGIYVRIWGLPDSHKTNQPDGFVKGVIGALFMIKREVIDKIGGLDNVYNPFLEEEIDMCERARRNGYRIYYVNDINITHLEGSTLVNPNAKSQWNMEQREIIFARNNYIFCLRYYPIRLPLNIGFRFALPLLNPIIHTKLGRSNIHYRFSTAYTALAEAIQVYNKLQIPKFKRMKS